jgi:aspartate aminotransferase/aminotransferase
MVQHAAVKALETDMTDRVAAYKLKRDRVVESLNESGYELVTPEGAFYAFPKAPWGTATEFVAEAIRNQLLIIPGNVFSQKDTHFRISYAVDDRTLERGLEVLKRIVSKP